MDSFGLRQEQSELMKSVLELQHKLEIGETRIKELHCEEMRYLEEIPIYKKQSEDAILKANNDSKQAVIVSDKLSKFYKELDQVKDLIVDQEMLWSNLKDTQKKIIEETRIINEQVKIRQQDLDKREESVLNRENLCDSRDIEHKTKYSELDSRELEMLQKEKEHTSNVDKLNSDINVHNNNIETYEEKIILFNEHKVFLEKDKEVLKNKLQKADILINSQVELKASLLLQAEKLSKEVSLTQSKQISLDKALLDLVNQENALKIKELKIKKMAHDAGLEKELKELEESLK